MRRGSACLFAAAALTGSALIGSAPALAQHAGHAMPADPAPEAEAVDHGQMGHGEMDHGGIDHGEMDHSQMDQDQMDQGQMDQDQMDHGQMDHGEVDQDQMDHSQMDHGAMDVDPQPVPVAPPPAAAGSGAARAADAIWGAAAMREARADLRHELGGQRYFWFMADRAEYRLREGDDGYLWDVQGYYGGDLDKFWFKSEGEGSFGEKPEGAEVQALYSRAIGPWFDLQVGVRQDFAPRDRTYAVIGAQGLAPYMFEVDVAAFLSDKGDLTAAVEAELDQRITQRLILQPRGELALSAQDIPELGIGAGIDTIELGVRLRYEFTREFAPYLGVEQEWKIGQSADYARLDGEDAGTTNFVAGVRFWF